MPLLSQLVSSRDKRWVPRAGIWDRLPERGIATRMQGEDDVIVFATTVHDPDGRLLEPTARRQSWLARYDHAAIVCTEQTDPRTTQYLNSQDNVFVIMDQAGQIGESRRAALRAALDSGAESILYCDFDRWLHWIGTAPEELAMLPERVAADLSSPWYVCLGRTDRAYASHPYVQQVTEAISNGALSLLIGHEVDATAGGSWLSACGAALILEHSQERTNATDLEWPALVHSRYPSRLRHIRFEGLEFETAEFYGDEIRAAGGLTAWISERYEQPQAWIDRLQLTIDSINAARRIFASGAPQDMIHYPRCNKELPPIGQLL